MPLMNLFISKHRKVDFEISILIRDLANVPLVSGLYYAKWRIKNASHPTGITERAPITDHSVFWNCPIYNTAQLVINKQHVLGACELKLEILQDLSGGKETHSIGSLTINLSEYADSGMTTRRYLLDHCKFNSTVKLSIKMNQKSDVGTPFTIPVPQQKSMFVDEQSSPSTQQPQPQPLQQQQQQALLLADDRSVDSIVSERAQCYSSSYSSANGVFTPQPNSASHQQQQQQHQLTLKKSYSSRSLPQFCKQTAPFGNPDDPSPSDLVEQLFTRKPLMDVQASS